MFKINTETNRIVPVDEKRFSDLGFTERNHLQEWLAHFPDALGEELLIIQKEFDGFNDTKERLDLLALDKTGNLVIIENKLDDSSRDVVWQALKYAGYCANLSKSQIVEIYQSFLNKNVGSSEEEAEDASQLISEFLDVENLDETIINSGQSQRLMFVAANYRKEVTNTVLWLLGNQIQCQCFKVTLYSSGDDLFLNVEQIIPTPESEEFMISMAAKKAEVKSTGFKLKNSHRLRLAFWEQALGEFKKSKCNLYDNINPSKDHWLSAGSGLSLMPYSLVFGKKVIRVEFSMERTDPAVNTFVFDELNKRKEKIEESFEDELTWRRMENKKACRIIFSKDVDGYNKEIEK